MRGLVDQVFVTIRCPTTLCGWCSPRGPVARSRRNSSRSFGLARRPSVNLTCHWPQGSRLSPWTAPYHAGGRKGSSGGCAPASGADDVRGGCGPDHLRADCGRAARPGARAVSKAARNGRPQVPMHRRRPPETRDPLRPNLPPAELIAAGAARRVARPALRRRLAGRSVPLGVSGRGLEFDELREYQPGDDVRSIDWHTTARTGTVQIKQNVEERSLTVMLAVDSARRAIFGSVPRH